MTKRVRHINFGLNYSDFGGESLYAYRLPTETNRFINELNPGVDDAILKNSHCLYFDGITFLTFENAPPAGSYIDSYGGSSTLTLSIVNKKITATSGTAYNIIIKKSDGIIWASLPCAEGAGTTCFDVSGNGNHAYCSSYTSLASFRGSTQNEFHYNIRFGFNKNYYVPYTAQQKTGVGGINMTTTNELTWVFSGKHFRSIPISMSYLSSNSLIRVQKYTNPVKVDLFGNFLGEAEQNFQYSFNLNIAESFGVFFILTIKHITDFSYEVTIYNKSTSQKIVTTHNLRAMNQVSNNWLMFTTGATTTDAVEGVAFSACAWKRLLSSAEIDSILGQEDRQYLDFGGMDMTHNVFKLEKGVFSYTGILQNGVGAVQKIPKGNGLNDVTGMSVRRPSGNFHNGCETKLQSTSLGLYAYGDVLVNPKFKNVLEWKERKFLVFESNVPNGILLDEINDFEND